ncbi:hypothetical protein GIB67_022494 [Kingdonia uniflora]|uniref:Uncharacterized protein n=1 Tax=Kingdonia uniflora TaxID=39325 RepID=A0A7J7L7B6_9MAGN|nr:hypothetical protein GIB67_022494 [Kingdonia uniflora]
MVGAIARGIQSLHSKFIKFVHGKAYHRESSTSSGELKKVAVMAEEEEDYSDIHVGTTIWVPHDRTRMYYPKGQEKVVDEVPNGASKLSEIHWFSGKRGDALGSQIRLY